MDNMKTKQKEDFAKMVRKLNDMADFLNLQVLPPTAATKGIANSTTEDKTKHLRHKIVDYYPVIFFRIIDNCSGTRKSQYLIMFLTDSHGIRLTM
jgi:hypothetical protein